MLCLHTKPEQRILVQGPSVLKVSRVQGRTVSLLIGTNALAHTENRFDGDIDERFETLDDAVRETQRLVAYLREGSVAVPFDLEKCADALSWMTQDVKRQAG